MQKFSSPMADALRAYREDGALALHTPGHKQGRGAHPLLKELITDAGLRSEVSLMEELDDLHAPETCIKAAQERAARLYGADAAFFSVQGTTGAIQAMALSVLSPGDTVLVPRNAHRSILSALILAGVTPHYLKPAFDEQFSIPMGVPLEELMRGARECKPKAAILVYPTYYGVAMDLKAAADFLHARGILLLVDEAHGAHLPFSTDLPPSAIAAGADLAASSTHKLLPSMTQTSILFAKNTVDRARVRTAMSLVQTTSPNNLLLASIDIAMLQMEQEGRDRMAKLLSLMRRLREDIARIPHLSVLPMPPKNAPYTLDETKVTVSFQRLGISGKEAEQILRKRGIQCELADAENVLFLFSVADDEEVCARLLSALNHLAKDVRGEKCRPPLPPLPAPPPMHFTPREAFFQPRTPHPFQEALGKISAEQITFYPPGIPILAPGEEITAEIIKYVNEMQRIGLKIVGPSDTTLKNILIIEPRKEPSWQKENSSS